MYRLNSNFTSFLLSCFALLSQLSERLSAHHILICFWIVDSLPLHPREVSSYGLDPGEAILHLLVEALDVRTARAPTAVTLRSSDSQATQGGQHRSRGLGALGSGLPGNHI